MFAAADAVLARGERPTVERVCLQLGRGSPARVGSLLDQWWSRLAERLNGETRLPALPGELSLAFVAVRQQAIHLAQGVVEQTLGEQRQVLAGERERVAAVKDLARKEAVQFRQQAAEAVAGRQAAECPAGHDGSRGVHGRNCGDSVCSSSSDSEILDSVIPGCRRSRAGEGA